MLPKIASILHSNGSLSSSEKRPAGAFHRAYSNNNASEVDFSVDVHWMPLVCRRVWCVEIDFLIKLIEILSTESAVSSSPLLALIADRFSIKAGLGEIAFAASVIFDH